MSLRSRLLLSIALALMIACATAVGLSCVRAAGSIRTELSAAVEVGTQTVRNGLAEIGPASDVTAEATRLVRTFDGDRHVRAALLGPRGQILAASRPLLPRQPAPEWFRRLVAPARRSPGTTLPLGATGVAIQLRSDSRNETSEVWAALEDSAADLLVLCVIAACATLITVRRALRPLTQLAAALDRVQPGRHVERVDTRGPAEITRLAEGFNRMEERLAAMELQNRRLNEQIMTMLDEERAELARDLHDEVGPYLFSISVSAATIERLAGGGPGLGEIPVAARLIREDVGHVQRRVRGILEQLRPVAPVEAGLGHAVEGIVAFWRARHPRLVFDVEVDAMADRPAEGRADWPADWDEGVQDVAYRVVQEAVSNALRHAHPGRIEICIRAGLEAMEVRVRDDGASAGAPGAQGLGLAGMAARFAGVGGTLHTGPRADAPGWIVTARLPRDRRADAPPAAPAIMAAG